MTIALTIAVLALAAAVAWWWARGVNAVVNHNARQITLALDRLDALDAKALTFARHSDVQEDRARIAAIHDRTGNLDERVAYFRDDLAALRAELDAHQAGSRHRKRMVAP